VLQLLHLGQMNYQFSFSLQFFEETGKMILIFIHKQEVLGIL